MGVGQAPLQRARLHAVDAQRAVRPAREQLAAIAGELERATRGPALGQGQRQVTPLSAVTVTVEKGESKITLLFCERAKGKF